MRLSKTPSGSASAAKVNAIDLFDSFSASLSRRLGRRRRTSDDEEEEDLDVELEEVVAGPLAVML